MFYGDYFGRGARGFGVDCLAAVGFVFAGPLSPSFSSTLFFAEVLSY